MSTNVMKFGGTSLRDAAAMTAAANIVRASDKTVAVVVSAPGKRREDDKKMTDILYGLCASPENGAALETIKNRLDGIANALGQAPDFAKEYEKTANAAARGDEAFVASRGEYFSARIFAPKAGFAFVDAADVIRFDKNGALKKAETYDLIRSAAKRFGKIVIPGFYGSSNDGKTITFPRGGSDITGALVAAALGADVYENYTDVGGFMFADPKFGGAPRTIKRMSYEQAAFLSKYGSGVLHEGAIPPAREGGVKIRVKNTFSPNDEGTFISKVADPAEVFGIAGIENGFGDGVCAVAVGCVAESSVYNAAKEEIRRAGGAVLSSYIHSVGIVFAVRGDFEAIMKTLAKRLR